MPREKPLRGGVTSQWSRPQSHKFWIAIGEPVAKEREPSSTKDVAIEHRGNSCEAVWNSDESGVQLLRRSYSYWRKKKWNDIPAEKHFRGHTFEAEVSKLVMRLVCRNDQDERGNRRRCTLEFDGSKTVRSISEGWRATFLELWLASMHLWRKQQDEVPVLQEFQKCLIRDIHEHTGGNLIAPDVAIPYSWKEVLCHRGCSYDVQSILRSGLIAGGRESKEGRQTIFFTPLNPIGDNPDEEEPSDDLSKPRKVHCHN